MSIPAGQARRSRIQWHDDGSVQRARNVFFEDGSPYRALILAAILGAVSIAAVVSVIQFQRQGGFGDVGGSLVEEAQASPAVQPAVAAPVASSAAVPPAAGVPAENAATAPEPKSAIQEETRAAELQLESAKNMVEAVSAQLSMPGETTALDKVEAIQADELQRQALEPLTTNDPRWQAVATASIQLPPSVSEAPAAAEPMAFASTETPAAIPHPEPAPRKKETVVAAVETQPEPAAEQNAELAGAKVRSSVFLRARPADGSKVLVTIPGGARIQVASGCRHWCAVTYQGKRGFVYKSFLAR